jgi:hypothetical protein
LQDGDGGDGAGLASLADSSDSRAEAQVVDEHDAPPIGQPDVVPTGANGAGPTDANDADQVVKTDPPLVDKIDAGPTDANEAGQVGETGGPHCQLTITDLTARSGDHVTGRVRAAPTVSQFLNVMVERIGARTTRDHLVMFERIGGVWKETDVSATSALMPRPGIDHCNFTTVTDVGTFGESNNGPTILFEIWTGVSPAGEFLFYLRSNNDPWNDCLSVSGIANQIVRGPPESLTDGTAVALGPDHDALIFRWGGSVDFGGDDWKVRAHVGTGFVGSFAPWQFGGLHSFAGTRDDGTIAIFRSQQVDVWKQDTHAPSGARITGSVLAWISIGEENLAATSDDGHLWLFSHASGGDWQTTDVTVADGETAVGRPTRYDLPASFVGEEVIIARNASGHLIYHWRDRNLQWHSFDLSLTPTGVEPVLGDPDAWATPVEAIAAQGSDGRLLVFDGLSCLRTAP